jgi:hypothetical protein
LTRLSATERAYMSVIEWLGLTGMVIAIGMTRWIGQSRIGDDVKVPLTHLGDEPRKLCVERRCGDAVGDPAVLPRAWTDGHVFSADVGQGP